MAREPGENVFASKVRHLVRLARSQSNNRCLRLAVTDIGGTRWTGGLTYRRNLLVALQQFAPQVEVFVVTEHDLGSARENADCQVIKYPSANRNLSKRINRLTRKLWGVDLPLRQALQAVPGGEVDLIFPGWLKIGRKTALLFWIPDFQHIHLPEMFTESQLKGLNRVFRQGIQNATLVMLSSRDAQRDFFNYAPQHANKSRVVNFAVHVPECLYEEDPASVARQYNLPLRFFYLPNQFWAHKNHKIVLEALKILKDRSMPAYVVCTGNPLDSRQPTYFAELVQQISLWGLRDQLAFLGLVPHEQVYMLMRQSICVLNPSLFEGWSTTVEEARSVGKCLLLSDLAVHREQDPPAAEYFDPHSPEDLAKKLREIWTNTPAGPDHQLEQRAREAAPARLKYYADSFLSVACEAVELAS